MSKTITLVSLNLWQFNDWENRFPTIIKLLKEINPDIICLQEVQKNIAVDQRNQIEILNAELGYPHTVFSIADIKHTSRGVALPYPVDHGLGVLNRFPFKAEKILLTKGEGDKEQRILLRCDIELGETTFGITNLHFSNSDIWAEDHFKETLEILKKRNCADILVGDFNIFNISKYKKIYGDTYKASSDLYDYKSYPNDDASLDYVLLPHDYEFESFSCRDEYVSDHRMLVAEISLV